MSERSWTDLQFWVSGPAVAGGAWRLNCTVFRVEMRFGVAMRETVSEWSCPLEGSPCTSTVKEWGRVLARGRKAYVGWARESRKAQ